VLLLQASILLHLGRCLVLLFQASLQCHHREPPNQVLHLEGGTGDRKLVCSRPFASLLQFAENTKPHLCIVERNSPTPLRRRFSLTQEGLGRVIPGDEVVILKLVIDPVATIYYLVFMFVLK